MGLLKCTIGPLDVSEYLKGLRASPGGDGRVGSATLTLTKEAAGLDIRPMMVVQVWETFNTAGDGVADRGRFFGGLVRNRDTGNVGTTKLWDLQCDDFNLIGVRGLVRDMQAAKAITLTAGSAADQVAELTQIIQRNGAITVNTEINTTDAVQAAFGAVNLPGVTYEGGHTYFWYLGQICAAVVVEAPAMRPTYYLGTGITVGASEDFGPPTLYLIDKANPTSPAFVFSDNPGVGEHPVYPPFSRKSQSNEIIQRVQIRTAAQVYTGQNATAQGTYPNPYINHGGTDDTGYWMVEPLPPVTTADNPQAIVDRKVESAGFPRDSYQIETDQRLRNGEYVELTWALEGLSEHVLQVVETEYRVEPTLDVWVRATLNARRLRFGQSAEDDVYAPPVEGDDVPPLPPENFALVSNVYNPLTGKSELTFGWDPSPSADTGQYQILAYASGGYAVVWEGDDDTDEATLEWEPGAAYEIRARAVDTSGNVGLMTDPALTGNAAVEAWPGLANPSFDYVERTDLTKPRYWTRVLVGDGAAFADEDEQMHGPRSLQLATFGGPTDAAAVLSDLFVAEGLEDLVYELRLFAKADTAGETLDWQLTQWLADGTPDNTRARSGSFTLTTDWAEYSTTITMHGDAPYMKLQLGMASTASRQVWVDKVSMEPQLGETGLRETGVTAGTYNYPTALQVGVDGRIISVTEGDGSGAGIATLNYIIDGEGSPIATGPRPPIHFDFSGTIVGVTLLGDPVNVGSVVLDIWSDTYGNYPPTVADTITASAKPTLSSATKYEDTTLTGWDTAITAGDSWIINVDSASTLEYVVLAVEIQKAAAPGGGSGHTIEDEGTPLTARTKLNFVGSGVTVTDDSGDDATVVTIPGGGGGSLTVEEVDGTPSVANVTEIIVSNGTLTDNGSGSVTITTGGGGGGSSTTTVRVPIALTTPRAATLPGNSFWTVAALTAWDAGHWEFVKDVEGRVYGTVAIPSNMAGTPAASIILALGANATSGVTRVSVSSKAVADGESINPGSLTAETAQDITVPGTARLREDVTFALTETLAADDLLVVEITHAGNHANDTLAVNTELYAAWLEIDTTT